MTELFNDLNEWDQSTGAVIHNGLCRERRLLTIALLGKWSDIFIDSAVPEPDVTKSRDPEELITVEVRRLAREITARQEQIPLEEATGNEYNSVYNTLSRSHLPELDEIGAIRYNSDRQIVSPGQNFVAVALTAAITQSLAEIFVTDTNGDHGDLLNHTGAHSI